MKNSNQSSSRRRGDKQNNSSSLVLQSVLIVLSVFVGVLITLGIMGSKTHHITFQTKQSTRNGSRRPITSGKTAGMTTPNPSRKKPLNQTKKQSAPAFPKRIAPATAPAPRPEKKSRLLDSLDEDEIEWIKQQFQKQQVFETDVSIPDQKGR